VPTVSTIIPTQRRPQMLREAAASALGQTFKDLELIIVLNAATPEAVAAAKDIARHPNVVLVALDRASLPAARNAGIAAARGEWVAFLDDDDVWMPTKIERQLAAARETGADLINCDFVTFGESRVTTRIKIRWPKGLSLAESLMLANHAAGGSSGAMIRTTTIRSLGGFDESMGACEDWDMWRRLSWNHQLHFVDDVLLRMRQHGRNMSSKLWFMAWWEFRHYMKMLGDTPP
jgi:glycosyltransferase involved in cell wall biosynthesis